MSEARICAVSAAKPTLRDTASPPVLGIVGYSGAGKTTLLERLIALLSTPPHGLRLGTLKHAHHRFDIDQPGKDSWRHRQAGARQVLVASGRRWALMTELDAPEDDRPPPLPALLSHLDPSLDLVLVEGFKRDPIDRLEVWRPVVDRPPLASEDPGVKALAMPRDVALPPLAGTPERLDIDDPPAIAAWILGWRRDRLDLPDAAD